MIPLVHPMIKHNDINAEQLRIKIRKADIVLGGNEKLKIYGSLACVSGKRMKKQNRVFFVSEKEAVENGYRPCGHCRNIQYQNRKNGLI